MTRYNIIRQFDDGRALRLPHLLPFTDRQEAENCAAGMNYPEALTRGYGWQCVVVVEEVTVTAVNMRTDYQQMGLI